MNNDYDRGESPRYTMTSFNKEISPIDISDPTPAVKLLLLRSGDTIISVVEESICGTKFKLKNPRMANAYRVGMNDPLYPWMRDAKTRTFDIKMDYVVTSTDPIDHLAKIYLDNYYG